MRCPGLESPFRGPLLRMSLPWLQVQQCPGAGRLVSYLHGVAQLPLAIATSSSADLVRYETPAACFPRDHTEAPYHLSAWHSVRQKRRVKSIAPEHS